MAIQVKKGQQETPIGRRLFATGASIVGGIYGGPAGAAAGGALGAKVAGVDEGQAAQDKGMADGLMSIIGGMSGGQKPEAQQAAMPAQSSAFSRRAEAKSVDPQASIYQGLGVLEGLPSDHPLKKELAPGFIQATMMNRRGGVA